MPGVIERQDAQVARELFPVRALLVREDPLEPLIGGRAAAHRRSHAGSELEAKQEHERASRKGAGNRVDHLGGDEVRAARREQSSQGR